MMDYYRLVSTSRKRVIESSFCLCGERIASFFHEEAVLRIARITVLGALIDTDHISFREYTYEGGYDFFRSCRELGVESLYLNDDDLKNPELLSILQKK